MAKGEYSVSLIRQPLETLGEDEQSLLVDRLIPVVRDGFGTERRADSVRRHILGVDLLYLATEIASGNLVGFGSFRLLTAGNEKVLYLSGVVFEREHQRKGLMGKILDLAIEESKCRLIVTRTQNPVIYVCLAERCTVLFPGGTAEPPKFFREVALVVADLLGMKRFDSQTFIEISTYNGCMTDSIPRYHGAGGDFAETFSRLGLVPERGDSAILVGLLRY